MTIIIIYPRVHVHQTSTLPPSPRIWVFVLCVGVVWGLVCWWGSVGWVEWWCAIPSSSTTRTVESERLGAETTTTTTTTDWMMDSFQWFCSCWQWRWRINCTIHFNSSSSHNYDDDDVLLPSVSDACLTALLLTRTTTREPAEETTLESCHCSVTMTRRRRPCPCRSE